MRNSTLFRDLAQLVDYGLVVRFRFRMHRLPKLIRLKSLGALSMPWPRQSPAGQRTPRNYADPLRLAKSDHLALFLAIEQVVMVLHRDKPRPSVHVGEIERLGKLPRKHR